MITQASTDERLGAPDGTEPLERDAEGAEEMHPLGRALKVASCANDEGNRRADVHQVPQRATVALGA